jgi:hypothetical protein
VPIISYECENDTLIIMACYHNPSSGSVGHPEDLLLKGVQI